MKKLVLLSLIPALFLCASCTKKSTNTNNKPLVFARPGDSVGLDMARQADGESLNIGVNINEPLVGFEIGTTKIEPRLATNWDISADGKVYTFYLREGVKFHDGEAFNAEAVKFSFERQWKKDHPAYSWAAPYEYWEYVSMSDTLEEIEVVNELTVRLKLKQPLAQFLANMTMPMMTIVSPKAVLKYKEKFDQHPVGTGPYKLKAWKKDDALELEAFDDYWGEKAHIKRVIVRVIPDNQVRLLELKRGSVHIMYYPNPTDLKLLDNDKNTEILSQEGLNVGYLAFNMKKPPLDKLEVRQAISMAIDRKRIVDEIFLGYAEVAKNPMPSIVQGYNPNVPDIEYNPEKAKALLKKVGLKDLELTLWAMPVARPYNPNARKMAEFMQADLQRIGIKTKIVSYDWGTYLDKIGKGEHDMVLMGWTGDNGTADNFLYTLWSKDAALKTPTNNYSYYMNEEVSGWMKQAQLVASPRRQALLYRKVLLQIAKDRPMLPIAHSKVTVPIRNEIEGYHIHPTGDRWFASVKFKEQP
jgi:ABC-type transport system substrate-binding protein